MTINNTGNNAGNKKNGNNGNTRNGELNKYWRVIQNEINQFKLFPTNKRKRATTRRKSTIQKHREQLENKQKEKHKNRRAIMTYNLNWRTVNLEKLEDRCKNNVCAESIAHIITENAERFHLDFIYLQEVKITNPNEWGNLRSKIEQVKPSFFQHYSAVGKDRPNVWNNDTPYFAGNIILYKKDKYDLLMDNQGKEMLYCMNVGKNAEDYRPVVFAVFEERATGQKIICINVHYQHGEKEQEFANQSIHKIIESMRKVAKYREANILLAGDFNHKPVMDKIQFIMDDPTLTDHRPSYIKTCCNHIGDIRKHHLRFWGSHIFSSAGKMKYILPNVMKYNEKASDHVPLISFIDLNQE